MALIPACTVGDLLNSDLDEYATAKDLYDARGMRWGQSEPGGRIKMLTDAQRREVIDLSARGDKPKAIADALGLAIKQVSNVRTHWKGAIDARRKELAGQNIDGTPATIARKPADSAPAKPDTTPEAAFYEIMRVIAPEPTPELVAAVHTHMLPQDHPEQSTASAPRMVIEAIKVSAASGSYEITDNCVVFSDGVIEQMPIAALSEFIADLQELLEMTKSVVVWNPYAAKEAREA